MSGLLADTTTPRVLETFDTVALTHADITSALPFPDPADVEVVGTAQNPMLRVISSDGKVAISTDGVAFTSVNTAGGLNVALRRIMKTSVTNPGVVVTAGLLTGSQLAISFNQGAKWASLVSTCQSNICDIAITPTEVIVTCNSSV